MARIDSDISKERRRLHFASLDEMLADARALAAGPHHTSGNWTLGQICDHLARFIECSLDGFDVKAPLLARLVVSRFKGRMLQRGFPSGVKLRGDMAKAMSPPAAAEVSTEAGLARLERAVARLKHEPQRHPSPLLGPLTHAEWDQFHLRHAELHLSFVVPE